MPRQGLAMTTDERTGRDPDTAARLRPAVGALVAVVVALAAYVVGQLVVVAVVLVVGGPLPTWVGSVLSLVADAIMLAIVVLAARRWFAMRAPSAFAMVRPHWGKAIGLAVLAFLVVEAVAIGWNVAIGTRDVQDAGDALIGGGLAGQIAGVLTVAVLVPVVEETVFRGFVYQALSRWVGPWVGAVLGGLVFAALHIGSSPLAQLVPLFVLGLLACVLMRLTGSLLAPIMLHCLNNGLVAGATTGWGEWTLPAFVVGAPLLAVLVVLPFCRPREALAAR